MFKEHTSEIQTIHVANISAYIKASKCYISYSSNKSKKKVIPGWNNYVERYKKDALFWHYIWTCNVSPRSGIISDIRNDTRAKYHYALCYNLKCNTALFCNKITF